MKGVQALMMVLMGIIVCPAFGHADPMEQLVDRFSSEYEGLAPPPNSSVHGDYKLERVMVGTAYTVKTLQLIYDQNVRLEEKYESMLEKYDEILEQNREMIEYLKTIAGKAKE